ncbi:MAG: hypothetical protein R3F41_10320 [Gammaproteobacteria bacterium]|nr:hypothetical protein [Pseudomonadales bacterium]MCP5348000.1 hypothetical protein [Pseudomonadales bacterium]
MSTLRNVLLLIVILAAVALVTLRITGLDPRYIDPSSEAFVESGRTAWPGLWLKGEVVKEPVENWDWVYQVNDPVRGNTIMLETRSWYGIPHSVTINPVARGEILYISGSEQDFRLEKEFPDSKAWWANVERDPRVRMKIDGRIYEMTVVLIPDRAEIARLLGRNPVTTEVGPDGQERITGIRHLWRVYQRNIPEYGDGSVASRANASL